MEVHARYVLMGLFALAVIGLGLGFVYWLEGGGVVGRSTYTIRYDGQVAGLLRGSAVLFNGVRVGEVTGLTLDRERPDEVLVAIAVERRAPVRADTKVGIEFQGLTGAPVVALSGGTASLPVLADDPSRPVPILVAEKNAGESMTQAARNVLRNLDGVIADNSGPLKSAIASIDKFTGALARNADKVDGILAGLDRLTGGGAKPPVRIFELGAATVFPKIEALPQGVMQIPEPTALAHLESEKILAGGADKGRLDDGQWPDALTRVVQAGLVRSFENAGYRRVIGRAPDGAKSDYQLLIDIRRFEVSPVPAPHAGVVLAARILKADGTLTEAQVFAADVPARGMAAEPAAEALREAFAKVAAEMVVWACGAV